MAKKSKIKAGAKSQSAGQAQKRGSKRFLLIILTPIILALGGGLLLYYGSKKNATAFPEPKLDGVDPAIVNLVKDARVRVERSPTSGAAWGRLGVILAVHNFISEADSCFALAEKYAPHEVRWPYWRGLALTGTNIEAALPCLERAAKICTNVSAVPLRYAEALMERGRYDEAEKQINRVFAQNTNDARALLGLARIALGRKELSRSLDYVTRSLVIDAKIGTSYGVLATIEEQMGNAEEAAKARRLAATLPEIPEWSDPFVQEANTYRTGKEWAAVFAESLLQQGRSAEAARLMQETTRAYPGFVKGWILLGQGFMETKDFSGAEQAFRTAARLAPDSGEVQTELGVALFAQARYAEAESCYREALRLKPNRAEVWFNLGLSLMNQTNNESAIEAFGSAARLKPDFTSAYIRWGQALGRLKRGPEAIEQLRHALELSPGNAEAKDMLEVLQRNSGKR